MLSLTTTVEAAESAFSVSIDQYRLATGRTAPANTTAPKVPAAIATDVAGTAFNIFGAPGRPAPPTATAGNGSATVTWTAPATNGSPITRYTVKASGGHKCVWTSGPLTCTVNKLTNGKSYTFTVSATNANGTGPASAPSNAVVPAA
jgi:hypothetical protein